MDIVKVVTTILYYKKGDYKMLTYNSKKIIYNRLLDKNIKIDMAELDTIIINKEDYTDLNNMYNDIVKNWGKLIII